MEKKPFYLSKTIWAAIMIAAVGILKAFNVDIPTDLIISLAGAFGIYGLRDAIDKNK